MLAGNLMAGWQLARALLVAEAALASGDCGDLAPTFMQAKITTRILCRPHPGPRTRRA